MVQHKVVRKELRSPGLHAAAAVGLQTEGNAATAVDTMMGEEGVTSGPRLTEGTQKNCKLTVLFVRLEALHTENLI